MRTAKLFLAITFQLILVIAGAQYAQAQAPVLLTEPNSSRAIALDSATRIRDPLPVVAVYSLRTNERRTRVVFFGTNMTLNQGENATAVTASARDTRSKTHNLPVEFVGQVPNQTWLTQVVVKLPDSLANAVDVWVSVTLHGQTSNEVLFSIKTQTEPRQVTIEHRNHNGPDNYAESCFSFEFGLNGEANVTFTRNDWDIQFGNSPTRDEFNVSMVGDDRSRIQDIGVLNWTDSFQIPVLPAQPAPAIEPSVPAIVGHMYVVHTKDTETDLYTLFRVEALDPLRSVTISWKGVQSPE